MAKRDMNDLLKRRMSATQQAAEVTVGDEAYEMLFQGKLASSASKFCDLPLDRLRPFFHRGYWFSPISAGEAQGVFTAACRAGHL
ncbi:MAG: hypothetical protein ACLRX4_11730 [Oscillospiraceae bacterium]